MTLCHIALGGNLGDVEATFVTALERLNSDDVQIREVSQLFTTPAMGSDAGGTFLNAAASLETSLDPLSLLERLLAVEDSLGRRRNLRWGPRVIDLDLVFYGDKFIDEPRLRVPHPGAWYRRFVLDPLDEIAGSVLHPGSGETVRELRSRLLARPFIVVCEEESLRRLLSEALAAEFRSVEWSSDVPIATLSLSRTAKHDDPIRRVIAVPGDDARAIESVRSILVAALSEPVVCASFDRSVGDPSSQYRYKPRVGEH